MKLPSMTIPSGQTRSNAIDGSILQWLRSMHIYSPSSLSGTTRVEVSDVPAIDAVDADYRDLQSDGNDILIIAGGTTVITSMGYGALRLETTVAPGTDEVYDITGEETINV